MFAGKTTETLKRILWAKNGRGQSIRVFKPASTALRAAADRQPRRAGRRPEAVVDWDERTQEMIEESINVVFFDEVKFGTKANFRGDILQIVEDLLAAGIDVVQPASIWTGRRSASHRPHGGQGRRSAQAAWGLHGRTAFDQDLQEDRSGGQIEIGGAELCNRCTIHWAVRT